MTESQNQFDKKEFADCAVESFQKGSLIEWLCTNRFLRSHDNYEEICGSLVELHNDGKIDLIASLQGISKITGQTHDFWQLQSLFTQVIPKLETQSDALMDGVQHLVEQGGQDMMANQPNAAFREWLKARPDDTLQLLKRAQQAEEPPLKLLTFVLEAGATQSFKVFFDAAINFLASKRLEDRLAAITALSRIDLSADHARYQRCLEALLSHVASAADANEVAQAISAILDVHAKHPEIECKNIINAIEQVSKKPTPDLHYLLARALGHNASKFSIQLQIAIITALGQADPSLKGVVDQIDFAFSTCLNLETRAAIADCLEALLTNQETPLNFEELDSLTHKLVNEKSDDLAWLVTHWLRYGSHEARLCLPTFFRLFTEEGFELSLSLDEFEFSDEELVFLSKKALGYLLLQAATAASILISCLNATANDQSAETISDLLFGPLMINFSGQARRTVENAMKNSKGKKKFLKRAINAHGEYLEGLRKIEKVPELMPSALERRTQAERQRQLFARSFKDAEKHSVFLNFVTKQTLLHGSGSINYVRAPDGKLHRSEMHLSSHGTSMEFPRFEAIDPVFLQNIIIRFRNEKMNHEAAG